MTPTEFDGGDLEERYANTPELRAHTSTSEDGTVECTIYPGDVSDEERTTRWITAEEGSYVDLPEVR